MTKLLGIGTKVKFMTTPDSGVIIEKLGDGMVMVKLDGFDMDIPAFEEDLLRSEDYSEQHVFVPSIHPKSKLGLKNNPPSVAPPLSTKPVFTDSGVQIAFEPLKKPGGEIEKFTIYLINDTRLDVVFSIDFKLFGDTEWSKDGILKTVQFEKIGELTFDSVNDQPELAVTIKPIYTDTISRDSREGVGEDMFKSLKIKPKQFIKNYQWLKFFNREVHVFPVFDSLNNVSSAAKDDLTKYTKDMLTTKKQKSKGANDFRLFDPVPNVNEYAAFVPEIDLHIEMIHDSPRDLATDDIVRFQIKAFETFLAKATRLNVPKIYVIHGIGTGRLRDLIAARLKRHPDILMFKNEYHEKYGFGATQVWLR
jgi:hypothetical protein